MNTHTEKVPNKYASLTNAIPEDRIDFSQSTLADHSSDSWPVAIKMRQQKKRDYEPDVVVRPQSAEEVERVVAWASEHNMKITPWGAGSSVTGAPLAMARGISLDMSRMNRIIKIDRENLLVTVEAGVMGNQLEDALNAEGFCSCFSPQSLPVSTVGGWLSTFATGQFSSKYGGIEDRVLALEAIIYPGKRIRTHLTSRAAVGPDLKQILIGAEGTLGIITEITLRIAVIPEARLFETVALDSVDSGIETMKEIMQAELDPFLLRFYDEDEAPHAMVDKDFAGCVLFIGFEGPERVAKAGLETALDICRQRGGRLLGPDATLAWMERRFDFSTVENILKRNNGVAETIEVAALWSEMPEVYRRLKKELAPYAGEVLGHFSHAYTQGVSLYAILLGADDQAKDAAEAESILREIWRTSMEICLQTGAAISHHHGVGIARIPYVESSLSSSMDLLRTVKHALDPKGLFNPQKLGLSETNSGQS